LQRLAMFFKSTSAARRWRAHAVRMPVSGLPNDGCREQPSARHRGFLRSDQPGALCAAQCVATPPGGPKMRALRHPSHSHVLGAPHSTCPEPRCRSQCVARSRFPRHSPSAYAARDEQRRHLPPPPPTHF
jgi:hypothetical protein